MVQNLIFNTRLLNNIKQKGGSAFLTDGCGLRDGQQRVGPNCFTWRWLLLGPKSSNAFWN